MRRLLCMICALVCVLTLVSCERDEDTSTTATDTTESVGEPIELTQEMIDIIMSWRDVKAWDITTTSMSSMVDDGDTENVQGYYIGFDGCMIASDKGNMYKGDTIMMNSALPVEIGYEMYYYDGWAYQIYRDSTEERLNTYERYQTTEMQFLMDYDGIVPTLASDTEFEEAEATLNNGTIVVSVTLNDGRARDELLGDIDRIAENNGVSVDDINVVNAALSYAIKDGKLIGYIGSFTLEYYVSGGVLREYSFEESAVINAIDEDVEAFTLPDGCEEYEVIYG